MLRWWQWVLVVVLAALAASFVIELWSPNGMLDQIKSDELQRGLQQSADQAQREAAQAERLRQRRDAMESESTGQASGGTQ
jgi:hypothetical protein